MTSRACRALRGVVLMLLCGCSHRPIKYTIASDEWQLSHPQGSPPTVEIDSVSTTLWPARSLVLSGAGRRSVDLAVDVADQCRILVVDRGTRALQLRSWSGDSVATILLGGREPAPISSMGEVALLSDTAYVVDAVTQSISRVPMQGGAISVLLPGAGAHGHIRSGIAVGPGRTIVSLLMPTTSPQPVIPQPLQVYRTSGAKVASFGNYEVYPSPSFTVAVARRTIGGNGVRVVTALLAKPELQVWATDTAANWRMSRLLLPFDNRLIVPNAVVSSGREDDGTLGVATNRFAAAVSVRADGAIAIARDLDPVSAAVRSEILLVDGTLAVVAVLRLPWRVVAVAWLPDALLTAEDGHTTPGERFGPRIHRIGADLFPQLAQLQDKAGGRCAHE